MKFIRSISYLFLLLSISYYVSSCAKSSTSTANIPTINPIGGYGLVTGNSNPDTGTTAKIVIHPLANTTSLANLRSLTVTSARLNGATTTIQSLGNINKTSFYDTIAIPITDTVTTTITITLTDVNSLSATKTIVLKGRFPVYLNYHYITIGAEKNSLGSFYSTEDSSVYTASLAKNLAGSIDFIYYYDTIGNTALFGAPKDPDFMNSYYKDAIASFGGYVNITGFYDITADLGLSKAASLFDNVSLFQLAQYGNSSIASKFSATKQALTIGNYYLFKTASAVMGIIQVKSITPASGGNVYFKIKTTLDLKR